jgi:GntR family transcriptional regulator of arabinose operon
MAETLMVTSKYEQMVEILKTAIESGTFPEGGRITSEHALSAQYGISRNTVREAISSLVQQGYLTRTQGKGTFVASRRPKSTATSDSYAIFLHAHSHVFEAETRLLVRAFQGAGALPIVFDTAEIKDEQHVEEILLRLLEQGVSGIVMEEGYLHLLKRVAATHKLAAPPVAIVNYGSGDKSVRTQCVFSDFTHGTRLGTRHLIGLGHRRILFVIHRYRFALPDPDLETLPNLYGEALRGYAGALAEAGLTAQKAYFPVDAEFSRDGGDRERLKALLAGPDRPEAVFAFGDYRAKHVIDIAADMGLRVPEDLAVIGYWNTPWAEMTRVPLTSVSIGEDEIARIAASKLLEARRTGTWQAECVIVKPQLVVRQSCGAELQKRA